MAKSLTDIYVGVQQNSETRSKNDLYPTPPLGTYALISELDKRIPKTVIEPCAGRGHIAAELRRHGHNVIASDLYEYENLVSDVKSGIDVFSYTTQSNVAMITNPPYHKDLPRLITEHFINNEIDFVALFLRLTFLEGKKRKKLFTEHPPSDIIFISDRINFGPASVMETEPFEKKDQIGGMIAYAWYVFDRNSPHINTRIRWVLLEELYDEWRTKYDSSIS